MADKPTQLPIETLDTPVPIEVTKKELKELAGEVDLAGNKKQENQEAGLAELEIARLESELKTKKIENIQITQNALKALRDDIRDTNGTLDTKLVAKENIIDIQPVENKDNQKNDRSVIGEYMPTPAGAETERVEGEKFLKKMGFDGENASKKPQSKMEVAGKALGNLMNSAMSGLGKLAAGLGVLMTQINKFFGNAKKLFDVAWAGFGNSEELDAWKTLGSSAGENIKNIGTIENPKKQELAALIAGLVPEGKKISSNALKPVLEGFDSKDLEGDELADALMAHIQANREKYAYEKPKPTEEELKKQEDEKKENQRKDLVAKIDKIADIDGKKITAVEASEAKDKKFPDYTTKDIKKFDVKKFGEYSLWELKNMSDNPYKTGDDSEKSKLINTIVEYFNQLTVEEQGKQHNISLNNLLRYPIGEAQPIVTNPETEKLDPKDPSNIVFYEGNFYQINPENKKFYYMYTNENDNLGRGNTASGIAEKDMLSKGKVISYNEANTTMKAEKITNNNIADLAGKLGEKLKPII